MPSQYLIQILLPLYDNNGAKFPSTHYTCVKETLVDKFGGVTAFMQSLVEGLWESSSETVQRDHIAIFEVMTPKLDKDWWQEYGATLERKFAQDKIIIRAQEIDVV